MPRTNGASGGGGGGGKAKLTKAKVKPKEKVSEDEGDLLFGMPCRQWEFRLCLVMFLSFTQHVYFW